MMSQKPSVAVLGLGAMGHAFAANLLKNGFRTVGSPPTLAQRVLNETLWNPAFFCCWKIEAAQGWNGRVSVAAVIVAKCRRLGGSRISGFEPLVSNHSFGVTSERDLLAFTPCRFI